MSNFSKKHYIAIAEVLRTHTQGQAKSGEAVVRALNELSVEFAGMLQRDNVRFVADHFLAVVRGKK